MIESFKEYDGVLVPPTEALRETIEDICRKINGRGGAVISWLGAEPVGSAQYHFVDGYVYIWRISVLPHHRGKGIGKLIISYLEELAKKKGVNEARLEVRLSIPKNIAYYKNLNYEVVEEKEYPEKTDKWYVMSKQL